MMDSVKRHPRGGLYFEEFYVGRIFRHGITRTVTQMDNVLFCNMTLNPQPLHIDAHFCATETQWGRPVVNSFYTLGLMMGISVYDTTLGTTVANLGLTNVRFHTPLFDGDTVRVETEIGSISIRAPRRDRGIVDFLHRAYNQDDKLVGEFTRQGMMLKAPPVPA
jgi:acyl dehydratase